MMMTNLTRLRSKPTPLNVNIQPKLSTPPQPPPNCIKPATLNKISNVSTQKEVNPSENNPSENSTLIKIHEMLDKVIKRIDSIDNKMDLMDTNISGINSKISALDNRLTAKITTISASFEGKVNEIACRVTALEENCTKKITTLDHKNDVNTQELIHLKNKVTDNELVVDAMRVEISDSIKKCEEVVSRGTNNDLDMTARLIELERIGHLNDVIIVGIPQVPNENLFEVFKAISAAISFDYAGCFRRAFRLRGSAIVLKLSDAEARNEFLYRYRVFKKLSITHIGFESHVPIVMNESLCTYYNNILKNAVALRKSGLVSAAYARNGYIYIYANGTSTPTKITDTKQLEAFRSINTAA